MMLLELVKEKGHAWKDIAKEMNIRFDNGTMDQRFGRTPENVKDKFKQLGGENIIYRKKGPWSIEESIEVIRLINIATEANFLKKSTSLKYRFLEDQGGKNQPGKPIKIKTTDEKTIVKVYDRSEPLENLIPLIVKRKRCKKVIPKLNLSWSAIQANLKTRSVDDIRNHW